MVGRRLSSAWPVWLKVNSVDNTFRFLNFFKIVSAWLFFLTQTRPVLIWQRDECITRGTSQKCSFSFFSQCETVGKRRAECVLHLFPILPRPGANIRSNGLHGGHWWVSAQGMVCAELVLLLWEVRVCVCAPVHHFQTLGALLSMASRPFVVLNYRRRSPLQYCCLCWKVNYVGNKKTLAQENENAKMSCCTV